jgi:hypothetical protein
MVRESPVRGYVPQVPTAAAASGKNQAVLLLKLIRALKKVSGTLRHLEFRESSDPSKVPYTFFIAVQADGNLTGSQHTANSNGVDQFRQGNQPKDCKIF